MTVHYVLSSNGGNPVVPGSGGRHRGPSGPSLARRALSRLRRLLRIAR